MFEVSRLEIERRARGFSKVGVGHRVGCDGSYINAMERGRVKVSPESPVGRRLARLFGLPLDVLLSRVELAKAQPERAEAAAR